MSVQTDKVRRGKRPNETGNEAIAELQGNRDVAQRAAAAAAAGAADHQVLVALAAYFIAEKRGFEPGHELEDWLAAEAELTGGEQPAIVKPIQLIEAGVKS